MARSICTGGRFGGCGHVFATTKAFDRHRTGDFGGTRGQSTRRCMGEGEMRAAGMVPHPAKAHGGRPVWTLAASLEAGAAFGRLAS